MKTRSSRPQDSGRPGLYLTIEPLEERRAPAAFVVTSNADPTAAGKVTLRDAINMSNATPGPNTITFNIAPGGEQTINLTSPLPALTQPVEIFGGSQNNTTYITPAIVLNGSGAGAGDGFDVVAGNSTIEGFVIEYFTGNGVVLKTKGNDEVINDCIGTNASHNGAAPNTMDGVLINNVANNAVQSCIISGNDFNGVEVTGASAAHNLIGSGNTANPNVGTATGNGNYLGVDYYATSPIPNKLDGVLIHNAANLTTVKDNIISGNGMNGVHITGTGAVPPGTGTTGNVVVGNFIGTDGAGSAPLPNTDDGVLIDGGANSNSVGDGTAAGANVISANDGNGVHITGTGPGPAGIGTTDNTVIGNEIGTDVTGTAPLGNTHDGVLIDNGANNNTIGEASSQNVISDNGDNGVHITGTGTGPAGMGTTGNAVLGNFIGTDITGKKALGNTDDGILIDNGANANSVGDGTSGGANLISANFGNGIYLDGSGLTIPAGQVGTSNNTVFDNLIGTDVTGTKVLGNTEDGVLIDSGATDNTIGEAGSQNVISNNTNGVHIDGAKTMGNDVIGNYIGTDITGAKAFPTTSQKDGVLISDQAFGNTIGGPNSGEGNVISANAFYGIEFNAAGTAGMTANIVENNIIGLAQDGLSLIPTTPQQQGVKIDNGSTNNQVGTADDFNIITGNRANGILITDAMTTNNTVIGNYIGTDQSGAAAVPMDPQNDGILFLDGAYGNTIGGPNAGDGNVISGNGLFGVEFNTAGTAGQAPNIVENNIIGLAKDGVSLIPMSKQFEGVKIGGGSTNNQIGTADDFNVISGNTANGVQIDGATTTANTVIGNFIGPDNTGKTAIATSPQQDGVLISGGAYGNTIGGPNAGDDNVISANAANGIEFNGAGATGKTPNIVENNVIGLADGGLALIPQSPQVDGVLIGNGSTNNQIGTANDANVISGNTANGIEINGSTVTGNNVIGNHIGTDTTGAAAIAGNPQQDGVLITGGAYGNTIGGPSAADGNVISGNAVNGIEFDAEDTGGKAANIIENNIIGLAVGGSSLIPGSLQMDGVLIGNGSTGITVGTASDFNVISGNTMNGVQIDGDTTTGNNVIGNYIGTDKTGDAAIVGNPQKNGVLISGGAYGNTIGGPSVGDGNVISANAANGIEFDAGGAGGKGANIVEKNIIGLAENGITLIDLSPQADGVLIGNGSTNNQIGTSGDFNVISGNTANGVQIDGATTTDNTLIGNYIGTDDTGAAAIAGNPQKNGVLIGNGAFGNTIGDPSAGDENVISANAANGIQIDGATTTGNTVIGNFIGTDKTGANAIALTPQHDGILISNGAFGNTIGGPGAGDENVISANAANGIQIDGATTTDNIVIGNFIGTDNTGAKGIAGNLQNDGVLITAGAYGNTIGGPNVGDGNVISANVENGVEFNAGGAAGRLPNIVENNIIGLAEGGVMLIPATPQSGGTFSSPQVDGVKIGAGSTNNQIGTVNDFNVISGNNTNGVQIDGATTTGNTVIGNYIGTTDTGASAVEGIRQLDGVLISDLAFGNTIGGPVIAMGKNGNVLSANENNGIEFDMAGTAGKAPNVVENNVIGLSQDGLTVIPLNMQMVGVLIENGSTNNQIGTAGDFNVISGNASFGLQIDGPDTTANTVIGNYIGTDNTGARAIAENEQADGVVISAGALGNTIGGPTLAMGNNGNVISANLTNGIALNSAGTLIGNPNIIENNIIGLAKDGLNLIPLSTQSVGVLVQLGSINNQIGTANDFNVISGNIAAGVQYLRRNYI